MSTGGGSSLRVERLPGVAAVAPAEWRRVEAPDFPFADHEWLVALERSGSVGSASGWLPLVLACRAADGRLVGAMAVYAKTNSYGEYIFDWEWARAYHRAGLPYYPKLVAAVPFTPATGPKLLVAADVAAGPERQAVEDALMGAFGSLYDELGVSSAHALFLTAAELPAFERHGYLLRHSSQFHWRNPGYGSFADYTGAMAGKRRRQIERERRQAAALPVAMETLTGAALREEHADAMYAFYLQTIDRKDAIPYLRPEFFREVFRTMPDRIVMTAARAEGGPLVAAALNVRKGASLFGRYWGAVAELRNLHFELCYYRTIEFAIAHGIRLFEAGAQGEHKLQRGFLPSLTYSAHLIRDPRMRAAIARYVEEERALIAEAHAEYAAHSPFSAPL